MPEVKFLEVGGTMQGRRVEPRADGYLALAPGDYGRDPQDGRWQGRPPAMSLSDEYGEEDGHRTHPLSGSLAGHDVVEHEDGTITVSPSILIHYPWGPDQREIAWHGYLERGVWRRVP